MPIEFDLAGCLCGTSVWILPGFIGGLSIIAGLYFGSSRNSIGSKVSICVGWVLGSIIAGAIGTILRFLLGRMIYKNVGGINSGSPIIILADIIAIFIIGLIIGLIGSYFTFTNLEPVSQNSHESDAA